MRYCELIIVIVCCFLIVVTIIMASLNDKYKKPLEVWETTPGGPYSVVLTEDEIACEHPKRKKESIRWDQIIEIRLATTDEGPFLPDMWYLFIGKSGGCSVPIEAKGFDLLWDELEKRFDGFDYEGIIKGGGPDNNQTTLWKK